MMTPRLFASLILTGLIALQSFASVAVPCSMPTDHGEHSVSTDVDSVDHSGHQMQTKNDSQAVSEDCCEGGYCSLNGCVSIGVLLNLYSVAEIIRENQVPPWLMPASPTPHPNSLLRPPSG